MPLDAPAILARIYATTDNDCGNAMRYYFDVADTAMSNGEFEAVDSLIAQIDASKLCPMVRCSILVGVLAGRPLLTQYSALFDRIHASYAAEQGQEAAARILKGLEPRPS